MTDSEDTESLASGFTEEGGEHTIIDAAWLEDNVTFLKVKTCKCCLHHSNELNPVLRGPFKRSSRYPCRPWAKGTHQEPRGLVCYVCTFTFYQGGFKEQHGSIDNFLSRAKDSATLADEFSQCAQEVIERINSGRLSMRLRGSKKGRLQAALASVRKQTVDLVMQESIKVKQSFKAIRLSKWAADNPGKSAVECGHMVKDMRVPGVGVVPCVLLRSAPEDEYDVEVSSSLNALMRETLEDGENVLRDNQAVHKFTRASGTMNEVSASAAHMKSLESVYGPKRHRLEQSDGAKPDNDSAADGSGSASESADDMCDDELDAMWNNSMLGSLTPTPKLSTPSPALKLRTLSPARKLSKRHGPPSQASTSASSMSSARELGKVKGKGTATSTTPSQPAASRKSTGSGASSSQGNSSKRLT
jgi:hypothetical protein